MKKAAKVSKREFQDNLQDIRKNLEPKKLFAKYAAQKKQLTEQRAENRATFEGKKLPDDPKVAIQAYFDSEPTKALYKQLEEDSTNKKILTPYQMAKLSRRYLKRLFSKMGIRLQVFGTPFTRQ